MPRIPLKLRIRLLPSLYLEQIDMDKSPIISLMIWGTSLTVA